MIHSNTVMMAATRGAKVDPLSVVDFMPSDSMKWQKRTKLKSRGIKHPRAQADILKRAFGFS
jgi:hypothetical protein